jgi:hypothetical protein
MHTANIHYTHTQKTTYKWHIHDKHFENIINNIRFCNPDVSDLLSTLKKLKKIARLRFSNDGRLP